AVAAGPAVSRGRGTRRAFRASQAQVVGGHLAHIRAEPFHGGREGRPDQVAGGFHARRHHGRHAVAPVPAEPSPAPARSPRPGAAPRPRRPPRPAHRPRPPGPRAPGPRPRPPIKPPPQAPPHRAGPPRAGPGPAHPPPRRGGGGPRPQPLASRYLAQRGLP